MKKTVEVHSLRALFLAKRNDADTLQWINEQLRQCNDDVANMLQMEVVVALRKVRAADPIDRVLEQNGLKTSDGRALHRYRVGDEDYEGMRSYLCQKLHRQNLVQEVRGPQHFVLFIAEWFRREYNGGQQKWEQVASALNAPLPYADTIPLTRTGLIWWRRKARVLHGQEERLLTLALEGGFPVRLFESEQGWLLDHLRRAVARLSQEGDNQEAAALAVEAVEHRIPLSFRGGEFKQLSAELICAVAALKREAESLKPLSLPPSLRLQAARPHWRDGLPVRLEGDGPRKLIDDLVSAASAGLAGEARARRLLIPVGAVWRPALEITLSGELQRTPEALRGYDGRVRVAPAGALSQTLGGDIALLEPPGDEGGWLARPRGPATQLVMGFPFDAAVEVELKRGSEAPFVVTWPRGEPERGELLIFADAEDPRRLGALKLLGRGSCRSCKATLYAWAPARFEASNLNGQTVAPVWGDDEWKLFRLEQPTRLGAADAEYAYRVEPGSQQDRVERLWVEGETVRGVTEVEGRMVYAGPPRTRGWSNGALTDVAAQMSWRHPGEAGWRSMREPMTGAVELIWRDPASRALRDRTSFVVLPPSASLSRRPEAERSARFALDEAPEWRLKGVQHPGRRTETLPNGLRVTFEGAPERKIGLYLVPDCGPPVTVQVPFPFSKAGFTQSNGQVMHYGARTIVDALKGARVFAPGRGCLLLELHGRKSTRQMQVFEEELPLSTLSNTVAQILSGGGDLDAHVVLTVEPGGACLSVGRYVGEVVVDQTSRTIDVRGLTAEDEVRYEWRSLLDPTSEGLRLVSLRQDVCAPSDPLPVDLIGPGLAVVRVGGRPLPRPRPVAGRPLLSDEADPLKRAVALANAKAREAAILAALDLLPEATDSAATLRWLRQTLAALDGTPPLALDVFRLLYRKSTAAAALLMSAETDEERACIWRLEEATPLVWVLTPLDDWRRVLAQRIAHFTHLLETAGVGDALGLAMEQVRRESAALAALDPLLRPALAALQACPGEPATRGDFEIAQERVRRSTMEFDAPQARAQIWPDIFFDDPSVRPQLPALFQQRDRLHPAHWESLEAPCAAALRAAGRITLTADQRLKVRAAMAEDPLHFAEAYAAFLAQFARENHVRR